MTAAASVSIFDALPGLEVPVDAVSSGLSGMWSERAGSGKPAPAQEDSTATQVNFVLHLGFNTTTEDAVAQFDTVVRFSHAYPCRVVVLCPLHDDDPGCAMRAKVYGECSLGKTRDDTRCCEFVMLSYPRSLRRYLENQVSICLSTDLPIYYWAHRFSANRALADYRYLLTRSRRVLIDSAVAPEDTLSYPWPRPEVVHDLALARLLPVRQAIGQFLSRYPAQVLADGLSSVRVSHGGDNAAEARVLAAWLGGRLARCASPATAPAPGLAADAGTGVLAVEFAYAGPRFFRWRGDFGSGRALFEADFGSGRTSLPAATSLLTPENALREAMFF
jgi:glucose-6-phosphate dehydrogenase assembly protein OpcA